MTERGHQPGAERLSELLAGAPPEGSEEREIAELFRTVRAGARVEGDELRIRRLRERVLAQTTRVDLSWRGELSFRARMLRQGLRGHPLLKIAAASLLLHLIALPAFAVYLLRRPAQEREVRIGFEPAREALPDLTDVSEPEDLPEAPALRIDGGMEEGAIDNALRRDRFLLSTATGPAVSAKPGDPLETELLALRTRQIRDRSFEARLDDREAFEGASPLARLLWTELLLDRVALLGKRPPLLARALNDLSLFRTTSADLGAFRDAVLDRARAYGVWEAEAGFEADSVPAPLGKREFELIQRASAGTALAGSPTLLAYRGWTRH